MMMVTTFQMMVALIAKWKETTYAKAPPPNAQTYVETASSSHRQVSNVTMDNKLDVCPVAECTLCGSVRGYLGRLLFAHPSVAMDLLSVMSTAMMATLFKAMGVSNAKWKNITLAKDNPLNVSTYVATLFSTPKCWKSVTMETAQWTTDASTIAQSIRVGSVQM